MAGRSESQLRQVLIAFLRAIECRTLRIVMLDKEMLDARFVSLGKNARPVDLPLADVDHLLLRRSIHVLHVHELKASGIAREVIERILPCFRYPEEIHLQLHQSRISSLEQHVVRNTPIERGELEIVIVVAELYA